MNITQRRIAHFIKKTTGCNPIQYRSFNLGNDDLNIAAWHEACAVAKDQPALFEPDADLSGLNPEVARQVKIAVGEIPEGDIIQLCTVNQADIMKVEGTFWVPDSSEGHLGVARVPEGTNQCWDKWGHYLAPGKVVNSNGKGQITEIPCPCDRDRHLVQRAWVDVAFVSFP